MNCSVLYRITNGVSNKRVENPEQQSSERVREARQNLKAQYVLLYNQVTEILYRHDPIQLAQCGAPADEYAGEASKILPQLKNIKSALEARKIIYEVFDYSFNYGSSGKDSSTIVRLDHNEAGVESDYQLIAEEIWTAWEIFNAMNNNDT